MNQPIFSLVIVLVCLGFIFINYVHNPQKTKKNYSNVWFIQHALWEKRKTSTTYRWLACCWLLWLGFCIAEPSIVRVAKSLNLPTMGLISILLILFLPFVLFIYSSYKYYRAGEKSLADKKGTLTPTKTPFIVYLCDLIYLLVVISPLWLLPLWKNSL